MSGRGRIGRRRRRDPREELELEIVRLRRTLREKRISSIGFLKRWVDGLRAMDNNNELRFVMVKMIIIFNVLVQQMLFVFMFLWRIFFFLFPGTMIRVVFKWYFKCLLETITDFMTFMHLFLKRGRVLWCYTYEWLIDILIWLVPGESVCVCAVCVYSS